jgi:hypothetical protein
MRPLSEAVSGAVGELLRAAPLSPGKTRFAWRLAVGPALERVTSVRLEDRVLRIEPTSPQWGRELARCSPLILERMQSFLGRDMVDRIVVAGRERGRRRTRNPEPRTERRTQNPEP